MFTTTLAVVELPALSVAVPVNVWGAPEVVLILITLGHMDTPDKASEHTKLIVTGPVLIPLTGVGVTVAVIVGGVLSRLTDTLVLAVFPALSVAVPLTT